MPRPPVLFLTQSEELASLAGSILRKAGYPFSAQSPHPLPRFQLREPETIVLFDLPSSEIEGRTIYTLLLAEFAPRMGALGTRAQVPEYCFMGNVPIIFKPLNPNEILLLVDRLATLPTSSDTLIERTT